MRKFHKTIFGLFSGLIVAGCAGVSLGGDHVRWTEEVKLSDGRVIEIQRHVELTESGFPVQKRGLNRYFEICYPPLGVHWKSRGGYQPDIFDIVDGKAYVHVAVSAQVQCDEQEYPPTGAIYFRWDDEKWTRISPEEFPAASEWNLLMQVKSGDPKYDPKGRVTLADKTTGDRQDSTLRYEQKRDGWKRLSESFFEKKGCLPYARGSKYCADPQCTRLLDIPRNPKSIFYPDTTNTCSR